MTSPLIPLAFNDLFDGVFELYRTT